MLRLLVMLVAFSLTFCGPALATAHPFGLGLIVGDPTGISGKLWLSERKAIDGAVAWDLEGDSDLHLHGDYLIHAFDIIKVEKGRLPLYYGIGGRVRFHDNSDELVGVRIPVGLVYIFEESRVDIFLEVVPLLDLTPETDFDMNAGVGARYFF